MVPAYPREEMERRICAAVEAGATLARIAARPGWPSRQTLHRWTLDSAGFAAQLAEARQQRRGARTETGPVFDEARSQAFLLEIRREATSGSGATRT
jgi:transposase-like protein